MLDIRTFFCSRLYIMSVRVDIPTMNFLMSGTQLQLQPQLFKPCCLQGAANQQIACLKGSSVCFRCWIHLRSAPMLSLRQIRIIMNFKWWKPTIVKSNIKHMEPKNEHCRPSIWLYKWWFMQWKCLKQAYVNLVE